MRTARLARTRGSLKRIVTRSALVALGALGIGGCAAAIGGGAAAVVVSIGALSAACYDYANVTVFDASTGHRTCTATVTASSGSHVLTLGSCYYAALGNGQWMVRASAPGLSDAVSRLDVDHDQGCIRQVHTVELTLTPKGVAPNRSRFPASAPLPPSSPRAPATSPGASAAPQTIVPAPSTSQSAPTTPAPPDSGTPSARNPVPNAKDPARDAAPAAGRFPLASDAGAP
jgi:hypothetical protein